MNNNDVEGDHGDDVFAEPDDPDVDKFHDDELNEMQRKVVAFAIEAATATVAAREREYGPHPDPALRVHAIAFVVVHALNEYASEFHLDWRRRDWFKHCCETAIAALSDNNNQLVRELVAEVMPTRWEPDTNTYVWA